MSAARKRTKGSTTAPARPKTARKTAAKAPRRPAKKPVPKAQPRRAQRKLHVVVTAGPTREYIDPVRYLSNESSGKMGFEIARAARAAGHRVTLIAGPVHQETPKGIDRVDVVSARDMLAAMKAAFATADAIFMAAAVADFRPARRIAGKWKKKEEQAAKGGKAGAGKVSLELVENPDLLRTIARKKGERRVIAFALETGNGRKRAAAKLVKKNADWIVLNGASALNAAASTVTVLDADGVVWKHEDRPKEETAERLVELLERDPTAREA